jgi:exodeoxyribonuclease V beta subunit
MKTLDPTTVPLDGRVLVEASAGTGKTYTIATLFARLVVEEGLTADQILVVTFTKAAASELKDRVRRRIRQARAAMDGADDDPVLQSLVETHWGGMGDTRSVARLDRALADFDLAPISTIHGFCMRVLRDHAFESGSRFDVELATDSRPARDTTLQDVWTQLLYDADPERVAAARRTDVDGLTLKRGVLNELVAKALSPSTPRFLPDRPPTGDDEASQRIALAIDVVETSREVFETVRGDRVRYFDDLLCDLRDALRADGDKLAAAIRRAMPAALIDEFQDTDPVQYEIFDRIWRGEGSRLFLIGDPKQAIYAFRGADLKTYLQARADVGEQVYGMDRNYRTDAPLVTAVNAIFGQNPEAFIDPGIRYEPVDAANPEPRLRYQGRAVPPLRINVLEHPSGRKQPSSWDLPKVVVDDVVRLVEMPFELQVGDDWRRVEPGDIAVLVDSKWSAQRLYEGLNAAGVPAVQYGRARVVDSDEALDVLALLDALLVPHDVARLRTALATRLFGSDAAELARIADDEVALAEQLDQFRVWRTTWDRHGIMRTLQAVFRAREVMPRLLAVRGGERVVTNLRHLAELLHREERQGALSPAGTARFLRRVRTDDRSHQGSDGLELRLESDSRAVQIVTMHRSKGLEYPIVFCPYLWKRAYLDDVPRFHAADGTDTVDLGSADFEAHKRLHAEEQAAERMRLAYVSLTRAKSLCVLYWGRFHGRPSTEWAQGPLAWLLHPSGERYDDHAAWMSRQFDRGPRLQRGLQSLVHAADHHVFTRQRESTKYREVVWSPPATETRLGQVRTPRKQSRQDLRIASFTALSSRTLDEGHDYDAVDAARVPDPHLPEVLLASFPRGAQAGTCVHAVFEHLDFQAVDSERAETLVNDQLARHGFDAEAWSDVLLGALAQIVDTPLGGEAPPLSALTRRDRLDELGFHLSAGTPDAPLTPASLAGAFAAHHHPYAARLARLDFDALDGLLKGYVDLIFRHDRRWYVVDYKTNHLGELYDDYVPEAVDAAMTEGHYVLQYHLYLLALHRYLRTRLPDYDYDRDIGGVRYLFVRGMAPQYGADRGVFADRPTRALMDDLDALFGSPT